MYQTAGPTQMNIGDEKFQDIFNSCLDKPGSGPLILDPHPVTIQLQVERFIGPNISKSMCELVWANGKPVGMLMLLFDGPFRSIRPVVSWFFLS
jgi:hypothetical protein